MKLTNKVAIVTGGSRGIGLATVKAFIEAGAPVILTASSQANAEKAVASLKELYPDATIGGISPNLADLADVEKNFDEVVATYGHLDILVNNAGVSESTPISKYTEELFAKDLMLAITKFGPTMEAALNASAPNMICAYIYELAGAVNKFYHETRILTEENEELKAGYISLIGLAKNILEQCISILGFSAPEKM